MSIIAHRALPAICNVVKNHKQGIKPAPGSFPTFSKQGSAQAPVPPAARTEENGGGPGLAPVTGLPLQHSPARATERSGVGSFRGVNYRGSSLHKNKTSHSSGSPAGSGRCERHSRKRAQARAGRPFCACNRGNELHR